MLKKMPWTLWWSIGVELLRMLALTASVSVVAIAFAATVKPLADAKISAGDAVYFMALAIPPMLAYVLPFAGGFAATLVYHRLATDNEMTAAQAGGISLRSLLVPVALMGLTLFGTVSVLNEQVIPRFLRQMARMVTVDMSKYLAMEIPRGRSVQLNNITLFAEAVRPIEVDPPDENVRNAFQLAKVMALEIDPKSGEVRNEYWAQLADMWFYRTTESDGWSSRESSDVRVRLHNVMSTSPMQGLTSAKSDDVVEGMWRVPEFFRDKPKFLTFGELRNLNNAPDTINWVDDKRRDLALTIADRIAVEELKASIEKTGVARLEDEAGRPVTIRASRMDWNGKVWVLKPPTGQAEIQIEMVRGNQAFSSVPGTSPAGSSGDTTGRTLFSAQECDIRIGLEGAGATKQFGVALDLRRFRTRLLDANGGADRGAERAGITIASLQLPSRPDKLMLAKPSPELMQVASKRVDIAAPDPLIKPARDTLGSTLQKLANQVLAQRHERWALASLAGMISLTGAVTAVLLARKQPLAVYLWTFLPAIVCMVMISGGSQTTADVGAPGVILTWAGVGALSTYAFIVYRIVGRH